MQKIKEFFTNSNTSTIPHILDAIHNPDLTEQQSRQLQYHIPTIFYPVPTKQIPNYLKVWNDLVYSPYLSLTSPLTLSPAYDLETIYGYLLNYKVYAKFLHIMQKCSACKKILPTYTIYSPDNLSPSISPANPIFSCGSISPNLAENLIEWLNNPYSENQPVPLNFQPKSSSPNGWGKYCVNCSEATAKYINHVEEYLYHSPQGISSQNDLSPQYRPQVFNQTQFKNYLNNLSTD